MCVLVRVLQRNRTNRVCLYIEREICFKELAHVIVEAGNSEFGVGRLRPRKS